MRETAIVLASADSWKTITDIAANAATVMAIAVGGMWAYWRFVRERTRWPRAQLELVVTHRGLTGEHTLLNVMVRLRNAGTGLMRLTGLRTYVYRVLPLSEDERSRVARGELVPAGEVEAEWPCIAKARRRWAPDRGPQIEPGEGDEYRHDFVIDSDVETAFVYVYVENERRARGSRELGWQATSLYDVDGSGRGADAARRSGAAVPATDADRARRDHERASDAEPEHDTAEQERRLREQQQLHQQPPRPEPALEEIIRQQTQQRPQ